MKILFLGDSITQGVGASEEKYNYVNRVRDELRASVINYGVSGTRIGRQTLMRHSPMFNYDFRLRAEIMECEADLVFVFGGTNDYGHGMLRLGDKDTRDEDTFVGNLRLLIDYLIVKYGREKLCFILPLHRSDEDGYACKGEELNEQGAPLVDYVNAMRYVLREYAVDFIDLYDNGIPKPEVNTGDEYTVDGVHPNNKGHKLIADKVCEYVRARG